MFNDTPKVNEAPAAEETAEVEAEETTEEETALSSVEADAARSAVTNALIDQPGFPARKADGELVLIVDKKTTPAGDILIDADGNEYTAAALTEQHTDIAAIEAGEDSAA